MPDEPLADENKNNDDEEAVKDILEAVKPPQKLPLKDLQETSQKQHAKYTQIKKSLLEDSRTNLENEQREESVEAECSLIEVTGPLFVLKQQEAQVEVDNSVLEATEPLVQEKQILEIKSSLSEAAEPLAMEKTGQKNFNEGDNNANLEHSELLVSSLDSFEVSHKIGSVMNNNQWQENEILLISGGNSCCQKPTSDKLSHVLLPKFQSSPADVSAIATSEKHSYVASDRLLLALLETDSYYIPSEGDENAEQLMPSAICKRCLPPATRLQNDEEIQSRHLGSECKTQKRHSWLWSSPEVRKRQARHDAVEREACDDVTDTDAGKLSVEERQPMIGKSGEQNGSGERRVMEDPDDIRGVVFIRPPDSDEDALRIKGQNVSAEPVSETQLYSANSAELVKATQLYSVSATQSYSANCAEPVSATQLYSANSAEPVSATQFYSANSAEPVSTTQMYSANSTEPVSSTQLYFTNSADPVSATQMYSANSAESLSSTSPRSLSRHVSFRTPQVAAHKMFK
jgi:hypothetical protein